MAGSVGIDRVVVLASEHIFVVARAGFPASRAKSGLPPASGQSKWAGLLAYSALGAALVTAPFLFVARVGLTFYPPQIKKVGQKTV
jgi:hypothetical protein